MTVREALRTAINELKGANIGTYGNDAVILLKTILNKSDVFVLTNLDYKLTQEQEPYLFKLLEKRKKRYPIAYITHKKEFYGYEFFVDERVLMPRPETELLIEEAINIAKNNNIDTIVDIGTGSGCIAIVLFKLLNKKVFASDISREALTVARLNRDKHTAKVGFVLSNGLEWIGKKVDLIVSNPPYVSEKDYENLTNDVKYEPKEALIAKEDGLDFIKYLITRAQGLTRYLILEFGYDQSQFIRNQSHLLKISKDLSGIDRVAVFKFS